MSRFVDAGDVERGFTAWEQEYEVDPRDDCERFDYLADATVLLDDTEVYVEPISQREHEQMRRRFFGSKEWQS